MKVLGLDTATAVAGIALVDGERVLGEVRHDTSGRGADLLVAIDRVCRDAGVAPVELDAVAIGAGPGSFTGLRIGMATAKGIAFAANRPLWAVSSLAALADDALHELADQQLFTQADGVICAVLDARRGEVFAGCFRRGAALAPERVMAPSELAPWVAEVAERARTASSETTRPAISFAGDAIDAHRDVLAALAADHARKGNPPREEIPREGNPPREEIPASPRAGIDRFGSGSILASPRTGIDRSGSGPWLAARTPSGGAVARLALAGARVDITRGGAPTYIRPSEAEVKYPDGVPGALRR